MDFHTVYELARRLAPEIAAKFGQQSTQLAQAATCIAYVESHFDPKATNSHSTAKGLMQILDGTKREVETKFAKVPVAPRSRMFDPEYNMMLGMHELARQMKRYQGDMEKAFWAYNQGTYHAERYPAGAQYVSKVRAAYAEFFEMMNAGDVLADSGGATRGYDWF